MLKLLVQLSFAFVVSNYIQAYQYSVDIPDESRLRIEECIQRSRKSPVIAWQAELACGQEYLNKLGPNNLTEDDWKLFNRAVEENLLPDANTLQSERQLLIQANTAAFIMTDHVASKWKSQLRILAQTSPLFDLQLGHSPSPFGISKRREVRTLSPEEWKNVTDVFRELYNSGMLQSFGRLHGKVKLRAHKGGAFLPWHRVFLVHFELEMKKINPSVSLPYWDYTIDYEIPQPYESVLWTPCFFGDNYDTVESSAFSFMYGAHGAVISRNLAENVRSTRLVNKDDIKRLSNFCDFKSITTGVSKEPSDHNLESLHDSIHDYVGGDMGVVEDSAYDPVFWFHHAFIDYIWESFRNHQTERCTHIDIESDYRPLDDIGWPSIIMQGPHDTLFGYSHLKTIDGLWRNWTEIFYNYEPQPVCGSTCSGTYLYCDNEKRCLSRTRETCNEKSPARKKT